jgi:hypothetical protein
MKFKLNPKEVVEKKKVKPEVPPQPPATQVETTPVNPVT